MTPSLFPDSDAQMPVSARTGGDLPPVASAVAPGAFCGGCTRWSERFSGFGSCVDLPRWRLRSASAGCIFPVSRWAGR